jgi:hypothetical protein
MDSFGALDYDIIIKQEIKITNDFIIFLIRLSLYTKSRLHNHFLSMMGGRTFELPNSIGGCLPAQSADNLCMLVVDGSTMDVVVIHCNFLRS